MKKLLHWLRRIWHGGPSDDKWLHKYFKSADSDVTGVKRAGLPWDHPDSDPMGDVQEFIRHERERNRAIGPIQDRDLMTEGERKLWEDIEGGPPKHGTIAYPPPAEPDTQQWITDQLQERTGGITRHPFDKTQYPTPPNAADQAARDYVNERLGSSPTVRAYFTHGYSMQRLAELKAMAERRDPSLTTEELQALRVRGIA